MRDRFVVIAALAAAYDRESCTRPGRYVTNIGGAMVQQFDGPSFFTYDGAWRTRHNDTGSRDELRRSEAYAWTVEPPCEIRFGLDYVATVIEKLERRAGRRPKIVLVGDSITNRQKILREQTIGAHVESVRADKLKETIPRNQAEPKFSREAWIRDRACPADALFVNTGAHFHDVGAFEDAFASFLRAFDALCPTKPPVVFRTTPEGNPGCNSRMRVRTEREWEEQVWSVINGSRVAPADGPPFQTSWSWDLFQKFNAAAYRIAAAYDWVHIADVVPLARLHPAATVSMGTTREGSQDCLHGNPAVPWYNILSLNVLEAVLDAAPRGSS